MLDFTFLVTCLATLATYIVSLHVQPFIQPAFNLFSLLVNCLSSKPFD